MVLMNLPLLVFALSFAVSLLAAFIGDTLRIRVHTLNEEERDDFNVVLNATLTLLGLLIGFSFSMAISRYAQRKSYEEAESNAIGTEYARADLLPAGDASRLRLLLKRYLGVRTVLCDSRPERPCEDQCRHSRTSKPIVAHNPAVGGGTPYTSGCPRGFRHERRVEFTRLYTSSLVESYPRSSAGDDGGDRH